MVIKVFCKIALMTIRMGKKKERKMRQTEEEMEVLSQDS